MNGTERSHILCHKRETPEILITLVCALLSIILTPGKKMAPVIGTKYLMYCVKPGKRNKQ